MHSKDGHVLVVGAKVSVEFVVTALFPTADTCNIVLERAEPDEQVLKLTAQAKQCTLVGAPPIPAPVSATAPDPTLAAAAAEPEPDPGPPQRCDCPAMDVPHTHEQGGPVALDPPPTEGKAD
jgi:hypothetical protein